MPVVQAWQHIYSNVEKEDSPRGRGGFQTLFYSASGLTREEVQEMEGRLLYFPSEVEPVKRLFFSTAGGKGVIAQIVSLPDPDQFGRKGRYLAHSLIFAPEALARFEADPFRLFGRFEFVTTIAQALARGDFETGNIPPVSLELPATANGDVEAARTWPAPELKKLALLALRADRQARERRAITFVGEAAEIESALAAAFLAVPLSIRPGCTFDTYFYRCNLVAAYFWAIGLPAPPVSIKFARVEPSTRRVLGEIGANPETAYEHWALAAIAANRLPQLARQREQAFALAEWLDGRDHEQTLLEAASPDLIAALFEVNPGAVQAALQRRVSRQLPPVLVERAAGYIFEQTAPLDLYRQLRQGFEVRALLESLYQAHAADNFARPSREEIEALRPLLAEADHKLLRLFLAYWLNPRKQLPQALAAADEADYRQFGEIALRLGLVEPFSLLLPGRGEAFLDLYLPGGVDNLIDLAGALLENGEAGCLSRLSGYVARLSGRDLKRLARLIDNRAEAPPSFRAAVEQATAALPARQKGIKGVVQAVLERLPGGEGWWG